MEALLSHNGIEFELRDLAHHPLSADELWALTHDAQGRQVVPITRIGSAPADPRTGLNVVLGYDPIRLAERLDGDYSQGATVYGRPCDAGTDGVLAYLREHRVASTLVDVDTQALPKDELIAMLTIPPAGNRTPYTLVDGTLVLGYDIPRLEQVFGRKLALPTDEQA
ncbi:MAG TPA: hypothetical protein VKU60_19775 [Chloroflexota bacterium]|nr:hypothetical protein [Chloroflexota bacterium]